MAKTKSKKEQSVSTAIQIMSGREFADATKVTEQNVQRALRTAFEREEEPPYKSSILKGVLKASKWGNMWVLEVNTKAIRKTKRK